MPEPGLGAVPASLKKKLKRKAKTLRVFSGQRTTGKVKPEMEDIKALVTRG